MGIVEDSNFQHILRILNTNVDGRHKVAYAITRIKGVGRRFANLVCKKDEIDLNKSIIANPRQFNIPTWFLNRQKDRKDGKYGQIVSNALGTKMREDLERMKKIRLHRGLRHYWNLRVRGQHTKTTGRKGKMVGGR